LLSTVSESFVFHLQELHSKLESEELVLSPSPVQHFQNHVPGGSGRVSDVMEEERGYDSSGGNESDPEGRYCVNMYRTVLCKSRNTYYVCAVRGMTDIKSQGSLLSKLNRQKQKLCMGDK
jgi:hypothetical protein